MSWLSLAWTQLRRDLRGREAQIIVLALSLAVSAVVVVGALNDRMRAAIEAEASLLIAADAIVESSTPIDVALLKQATEFGLQHTQSIGMPTMAFDQHDDNAMVMLKAVQQRYPLRGELRLRKGLDSAAYVADTIPSQGKAWVAAELGQSLDVRPGQIIFVGNLALEIEAFIEFEPDRGGGIMGLSPRLMLNAADLPASELIAPGSRVSYRLMLAGSNITQFAQWLAASEYNDRYKLKDVRQARPESRTALDRVGLFFSLASMITVLVAGAAMLVSAQDFVRRQARTVAIYRCMGADRQLIARINITWLVVLALIGFTVGASMGWLLQSVAANWLGSAFSVDLAPAPLSGLWRALATAFLVTLGFAYAPLRALTKVSVMSVLRAGRTEPGSPRLLTAISLTLCFALLVALIANNFAMGLYMTLGLWATVVFVYLSVRGVAKLAAAVPNNLQLGWRFGIGSFARRGALSAVQATALALGILALSTLSLVVEDLLDTWDQELPAESPNYFLINIQAPRAQAVSEMLEAVNSNKVELIPVVRGRLVSINGNDSVERSTVRQEGQGQRREWNLTYATTQRDDNPTAAGQWWSAAQAQSESLISIEAELAADFGIKLGDTVTFRIAGAQRTAKVVHMRSVKWQSLKPNFYVIATPFTLENEAQSYMSAVYVPAQIESEFRRNLKQFPGISALDVKQLMARVRGLLAQAVLAVRIVFVFALVSGLLVLWSAVHATRGSRAREVAVLRVFGASERSIAHSLWSEYAVLGGVAAFVALSVAQLCALALGTLVFDLSPSVNLAAWCITLFLAMLLTALAGAWALRAVMHTPPVHVLRAE